MHKQMTHTHPTHRTLRVENSVHYQSIQCLSGPPVVTQVPHPDALLGKDTAPSMGPPAVTSWGPQLQRASCAPTLSGWVGAEAWPCSPVATCRCRWVGVPHSSHPPQASPASPLPVTGGVPEKRLTPHHVPASAPEPSLRPAGQLLLSACDLTSVCLLLTFPLDLVLDFFAVIVINL